MASRRLRDSPRWPQDGPRGPRLAGRFQEYPQEGPKRQASSHLLFWKACGFTRFAALILQRLRLAKSPQTLPQDGPQEGPEKSKRAP
eukprot:2960599-Pyramimonas_sp.AAC.1